MLSATRRQRGRFSAHLIRIAILWAAFLLIAPVDVLAQAPMPAPVPTAPVPAAESEAAAPQSREQLRQLLDTLRDPEKRAALEGQIEGLLAVQDRAAPPPEEEHGLGASVLETLSSGFHQLGGFVGAMSRAFGDSGRLWAWLERQTTSPAMRALWLDILGGAALSIGGALLAALGLRLALAPARRRLARRAEGGLFRRIRFSAARVVLDLVPAFAFAVVALGVLAWAAPPEPARLVLLAILNASVVSMAALAIGRWLFSPMLPELRVLPLSDASAVYLYIWSRRLILVLVWGYVVLQAALLLGLPSAGYLVALKLLGLVVTALLVVLVLQNRETVARHIRGRPATPGEQRRGRRILPGPVRGRLAEVWHVLALIYVVGVYAVWALEISGGFVYLMRATGLSLLVIALVSTGEVWVPRLFDRLSGIDAVLRQRYPFVADRANRYLPLLRRVAVYAIRFAALLIILAAWQVDVAGILFGETGRTILSRLADIVIVLVLSLAAWEISSGLITAHLNRRDASGLSVIRSARVRTLLPLIRNALLILISVMAALVVLSEIGVDIAPLLAGAGVVGLAIGFGAQSLVKDVITGAFFMIEGTMNIGDVVDINGKGGLVEGMTVRSIRLRDYNGAVHTINFGSVGTVTNMTRDFSYFLFDTKVALRYDVDAVIDVLRRTDEEMRADIRYKHDILEPLEVAGVEAFGDTTFIIRSRLKTRPIRQWDLGRAFLRRLKRNMAAADIEMAVPALPAHVTIAAKAQGNGHAAASTAVRQAPDQDGAEDQAQAEDRPGRVSSP